jgi:hypothetical protein
MLSEWLLFNANSDIFSYIMGGDKVNFQRCDVDVGFVLNKF